MEPATQVHASARNSTNTHASKETAKAEKLPESETVDKSPVELNTLGWRVGPRGGGGGVEIEVVSHFTSKV
ncbi:hypothetical protein CEXT_378431 [Caerostris extrusa]|uniref:Uncharacterized protein n=1 Tax=Caerostris extrusa TaxID=172846 RepID=A0AAV4PHY8_CAEEX|nr:hypothetical protein CEXT_378431 [Caerostris extrusa]